MQYCAIFKLYIVYEHYSGWKIIIIIIISITPTTTISIVHISISIEEIHLVSW